MTSDPRSIDVYTGLTDFPIGIGPGTTSFSGDFATGNLGIGVQTLTSGPTGRIFLPDFYSSGRALSATTTWTNQTIEGLGLAEGTYVWEWSSDRVVVTIGVPEPSLLPMVGSLSVLAFARRRKHG